MKCAMENHNGSVQRMAEKWGKSVKGKANLARANQLRFFKLVWLSNSSPHALVINVISTDLDKKEAPMKVHPDIVKTGLKTPAEVRTCLKSEEMYLNPAMYNLMCCGLENGKLKNGKKYLSRSSLRCLVTVAHEAHIRLELYLALKRQRYHIKPNTSHAERRIKMWEAFCDIVFNDRERNAETAEQARLAGNGVGNEDNADIVEAEVKSLCNEKYW
jgi:hypothetical protein